MIPQHIYDAIIESPAGKLIDRLIAEDYAKGGDSRTPNAHGSIMDQLYETITTAQKKYRVVRLKQSNQQRLAKYQAIADEQKPTATQWDVAHDYTSWKPTGKSDDK